MKIALLTLLRLLCTTSATTRETSTSAIEADEIEPTHQFIKKKLIKQFAYSNEAPI